MVRLQPEMVTVFICGSKISVCVRQLMEVTGKNQDECMVALHDCNEDVNRAINFLLESTSDTVGTASQLLLLLIDLVGHSLFFDR